MERIHLTEGEKKRMKRRFRVQVILSAALPITGIGIFLLTSELGLPFPFSLLGSMGLLPLMASCVLLMAIGVLLGVKTSRCPCCGRRIKGRSPFYKLVYTCPDCGFRADGPSDPVTDGP